MRRVCWSISHGRERATAIGHFWPLHETWRKSSQSSANACTRARTYGLWKIKFPYRNRVSKIRARMAGAWKIVSRDGECTGGKRHSSAGRGEYVPVQSSRTWSDCAIGSGGFVVWSLTLSGCERSCTPRVHTYWKACRGCAGVRHCVAYYPRMHEMPRRRLHAGRVPAFASLSHT